MTRIMCAIFMVLQSRDHDKQFGIKSYTVCTHVRKISCKMHAFCQKSNVKIFLYPIFNELFNMFEKKPFSNTLLKVCLKCKQAILKK